MKMKLNSLILSAVALIAAASCANPKKILYFQDTREGTVDTIAVAPAIRFQPGDKLYILVNTRDPQLTALFNLHYPGNGNQQFSRMSGSSGGSGAIQSGLMYAAPYTIEADGCINFPVIGKLNINGLSRPEVIDKVYGELVGRDLVKEPVVFVEYCNQKVDMLGSVSAGPVYIDRDYFTVIDAISQKGDLKMSGRRDNIKVIRQEGSLKKTYCLDLRNEKELLKSPAYYLRQNDIIYVEPLRVEQNASTVNGNTLSSIGFWTSVPSLAISLFLLIRSLIVK